MSDEDDILDESGIEASDDAEGTDEWAAAMEEQASAESGEALDGVSAAQLDELVEDGTPLAINEDNPDLEVILDIPVQISMVVGNNQISIRNLLKLNQGSVIELDRMAGEPLDVLVNNTLIAHGEVVVVNEKFGIRLTDVASATDRIRNLG